jgi:uncharacterized repeat protein (TIGR01451 family)
MTGQNLTYTILISNAGPADAAAVTVADPLPPGTLFVSCSATQGTCGGPPAGTNGTVNATLGTIASGSSATLSIIVNVTAVSGTLINTATASSSTPDPDPSNNSGTSSTGVNTAIPMLELPGLVALAVLLMALALALLRRS